MAWIKGLADGQQAAESGNRQTNPDGSPLVGKYPDGTEPSGDKKAYGISQISVPTAKQTAAQYGIPWDENKLMTDEAYNKQLGDAYMNTLRQHFNGDETLAVAAYHQGQGTVDKAVSKYGRQGFMQGIGPLGQQYVGKVMGTNNTPTPLQSNQAPQLSSPEPASPQEILAMQQPKKFDVQNPYTSAPVIGGAVQMTQDRAVKADDMLGGALATLKDIQAQRLEAVTQAVSAKQSLNNQMGESTDAAIAKSAPIFARQQDLVNRQDELRKMNPIARLFKGLTDSRYNEVGMQEEQATNSADLNILDQEYKHTQSLRTDRQQELNQTYADQNALLTAKTDSVNLDLDGGARMLASANSVLSSLLTGTQAQSAVDAAQNTARKNILANLDEGQVTAALTNAKQTGATTINGINFSHGELQQVSHDMETQRLGMDGMRIGAATGQLQFANAMEDRTIATLTPDQKVAALAAGGVFKGQQFDRGKLAQSIEQDKGIAVQTAQNILSGDVTQQFSNATQYFQNRLNSSGAQVKQLIGNVPDGLNQFYTQAATRLANVQAQLKQADAQGAGKVVRQQLMGEIADLQKGLNTQLQTAADSWAGGNKTIGKVAGAWLTGGPVSPQESAEAMVFMSRNNTNTGITSDMGQSVMAGVRGIVTKWDHQHQMPGQKKDEAGLISQVSQFVQGAAQDRQLNNAISMIPSLARQTTDETGKAHPLSRISPHDFQAATHAGDSDGVASVAKNLGFQTPEQMQQFMRLDPAAMNQSSQALLKTARDRSGNPNLQPSDIGGLVFNSQVASTIRYLNTNFGTPEFQPGEAYADLLTHPEVMKKLLSAGGQASGGFTDYAVTSAAGSGYPNALGGYIKAVGMAASSVRQQTIRQNAQQAQQLASDPAARTRFVLGMIPNLTQTEENLLSSYIQQNAGFGANGAAAVGMRGGAPILNSATNDRIDTLIMGSKIADPALEAIRKKAALHWTEFSAAAARGSDRLSNGGN